MTKIAADTWIRNGFVVDPARGVFDKRDVVVRGNTVVEPTSSVEVEAQKIIDAAGYFVFPGLIDFHTHLFHGGSEIGLQPDLILLPQGVTTAVDQGSSGTSNCEAFFGNVVRQSRLRIFASLHVSPIGLTTIRHHEPLDPNLFDLDRVRALLDKYKGSLIGLKIRIGQEIVEDLGLKPLEAALQMAETLGCSLTVHTTNPPGEMDDLVNVLRKGDVFTHMYHGTGSTIISSDGTVKPSIRRARARGVIFDTADARVNFAFRSAKAAVKDGFLPDTISSDLIKQSAFELPLFGLPMVMSKYLSLGMDLTSVVKACTATPAFILGMEGRLGTLAPGAFADISIFQLKDQPTQLRDVLGDTWSVPTVLVPRLTMLDGMVVYRSIEF